MFLPCVTRMVFWRVNGRAKIYREIIVIYMVKTMKALVKGMEGWWLV